MIVMTLIVPMMMIHSWIFTHSCKYQNIIIVRSLYLVPNTCPLYRSQDPDETLSASESEWQGEENMDVSLTETFSIIELQHGPKTREECTERLRKNLKQRFHKVNDSGKHGKLYTDHVQQGKAIVDINLLLELFKNNCQIEACGGKCEVDRCKTDGCVVTIKWRCSVGHFGSWSSSKVLCQKKKQNVFTSNVMIAAGLFITGGYYEKFSLFCKFLGLKIISRSTFMRVQKRYVIPVIEQFWTKMKETIWHVFKGESTILCGDGRNDSPGHSAKYCVYVLMEQFVDVIVDLVVVDKRETGGGLYQYGSIRIEETIRTYCW